MRFLIGFVSLLASVGAVGVRESRDARDAREHAACRPFTNCEEGSRTSDGFIYEVNDHEIIVNFLDNKYFTVWCDNNSYKEPKTLLSVDDAAMPAMSRPVTVERVVFKGCMAPRSSYYDTLKALNVTVSRTLLLKLPDEPKLEISHMRSLQITNLEITADTATAPPHPAFNYLDELPGLRTLKLTNVVPEPEALKRLPTTLENISFVNARLPAAERTLRNSTNTAPRWLERLHSLRALYIVESTASAAQSPGATLTPPQLGSLPNLTSLALYHMPLDSNGLSSWLKNSTLKNLILVACGLRELDNMMFEGANLTKLILTYNNLTDLPNGVFSPLSWLSYLDLSNNKLNSASLVRTVSPLKKLRTLKVNNNPLGSVCGDAGPIVTKSRSQLPVSLSRLELSGTNSTRICSDWIENDALMHIDLSNNDIGDLTYSELAMKRTMRDAVWLNLSNNPHLRMIEVSRSDVNKCIEDATTSSDQPNVLLRVGVELKLSALACDCGAYWLREVLMQCPLLQLESDVKCTRETLAPAHATLLSYGPDEILCPYDDICLPECSCWKRPRDNATVVRCEGQLPRQPRWPPAERRWPLALHVAPGTLTTVPRVALVELHAPNNNITRLDDKDIPDTLRVLDVRNNSISHVLLGAAQLLGGERAVGKNYSVYLSGNPLACTCADAPVFGFLKRVVLDWNTTQCVDKTFVSGKTKSELCANLVLPILFGVVVPLLMLVVAALVLQRLLPHVKQLLFRRSLCLRWILSANDNINDPNKTHDVFLSYSYDDLEQLKVLKNGLESRGYTTIEHCRDWQPGDPVMEQIARSVLCARRTLLLVSDNYAKSKWAIEEFHAAHAHAMERRTARVLIVRCGLTNPKDLPLDLQQYLYNNTYLAWDDSDFWYKLCRVMPLRHQENKRLLFESLDQVPPSPLLKQDIYKNLPLPQEMPLVPQLVIEHEQRSNTVPSAC